eukprot:scaffold168468_cov31-Tisochrysis_lutea.AAC.3
MTKASSTRRRLGSGSTRASSLTCVRSASLFTVMKKADSAEPGWRVAESSSHRTPTGLAAIARIAASASGRVRRGKGTPSAKWIARSLVNIVCTNSWCSCSLA